MQLTWNDVLKKNPWILNLTNIYFSVMTDMNTGKASTKFREKADELNNIVLENKSYQTTRFVRSMQRCYSAALRNLPTLYYLIGAEYKFHHDRHDMTKAKEFKTILDKLQCGENFFFLLGITQLLENYIGASLGAQYASHFPTQIWSQIDAAMEELGKWSNEWTWNENKLKFSGSGTPQQIVTEVLREGVYTPYVAPEVVIRKIDKVKDFPRICEESGTENIFEIPLFKEENQRVLELAGNLPIANSNDQTLRKVQDKLKKIAGDLRQCMAERLKKTNLQLATIEAFGKIHGYENLEPNQQTEKMLGYLQKVIKALPPRQKELFDANSCLLGFMNWNSFWKSSVSRIPIGVEVDDLKEVHIYYQNWVNQSKGQYSDFQEIFEICMIRSMSEAMCETVGSIMNQHSGKNRYLDPAYFSMELVLRVNLGPLHLLDSLIEEVLDKEKIDFIRSEDRENRVSSGDLKISAAVHTFQKIAEEKSRFPPSFWLKSEKDQQKL